MTAKRWTLLDESALGGNRLRIDDADVPGAPTGWSVERRRLTTGLSAGVDVVEVCTPRVRMVLVPTRGMGLWRASIDGVEVGWQSPVRGPVHPALVPVSEPSGLGWLDGFDETMCRGGLESFGAPDFDAQGRVRFPLHGRIANQPAHRVDVEVDPAAGTITVEGVVDETRFHFQKLRLRAKYVVHFNTGRIAWQDQVTNFGGTPARMQMLYHFNVGLPFLGAGAKLLAPIAHLRPGSAGSAGDEARRWADYDPPTPGRRETVYYVTPLGDERGETLAVLKNAAGTQGIAVGFNLRQLPYFTQWKNEVAAADGYVTGLEPGTSFPNPSTVEEAAGRVLSLAPGESWHAAVTLDLLANDDLARAEARIADLQSQQAPKIDLEMSK